MNAKHTSATIVTSATLLGVILVTMVSGKEPFGTKTVVSSSKISDEVKPWPAADPSETATAAPTGARPDLKSVLVHLTPGTDRRPIRQFAAGRGGHVKYEYKILPNVINLRGIPEAAIEALSRIPGVLRIEEDTKVHVQMNNSMPLVRGLQSQITGAGLSADGAGVRICIVDTGIDSDNFMYADRIDTAAGYDFVNDDSDPEDDYGHGSHVAGIAAGASWEVTGCSGGPEPGQGVAPEATLIAVKVIGADGSGNGTDLIAGIDYCADSSANGANADVINMSLTGGSPVAGACDSDVLAIAANNAVDAGVVVVAASGNQDIIDGMGSPACGSKVISVGATYDTDYPNCERSDPVFEFCTLEFLGMCIFSCTDTNPVVDQIGCYSNEGDQLDVVAPGCITYSADMADSAAGLIGYCGTSMASPHVAGLAALILSVDPTLTPTEVQQIIRDGALDMGDPGFDWVYGYGRIDVINSLSLLQPNPCGNGVCDPGEDSCNCPADCTGTETNCSDGVDDDCDGDTDCDDSDCTGCDTPPNAVCQSITRQVAAGETLTVYANEIAGFSSAGDGCCTLSSILIRRPGGVYGDSITFTVDDIATNPNAVETQVTQSDSQTAECSGHVTIESAGVKPVLTGAVSRKTHTGAGDWDIDVGIGDIESRSAQVNTANPNELLIVATFDIDVALLGGSDVTTDVGIVFGVVPGAANNELEIAITDLTLNTQINLGFAGVVDATNPDPAFASDSTLCVRVIVGDYDNLGRTNFTDFALVKNALYINQLVDSLDKARADFDCSGRPNFTDFARVKNAGLINQTAPACPVPPIGP